MSSYASKKVFDAEMTYIPRRSQNWQVLALEYRSFWHGIFLLTLLLQNYRGMNNNSQKVFDAGFALQINIWSRVLCDFNIKSKRCCWCFRVHHKSLDNDPHRKDAVKWLTYATPKKSAISSRSFSCESCGLTKNYYHDLRKLPSAQCP